MSASAKTRSNKKLLDENHSVIRKAIRYGFGIPGPRNGWQEAALFARKRRTELRKKLDELVPYQTHKEIEDIETADNLWRMVDRICGMMRLSLDSGECLEWHLSADKTKLVSDPASLPDVSVKFSRARSYLHDFMAKLPGEEIKLLRKSGRTIHELVCFLAGIKTVPHECTEAKAETVRLVKDKGMRSKDEIYPMVTKYCRENGYRVPSGPTAYRHIKFAKKLFGIS